MKQLTLLTLCLASVSAYALPLNGGFEANSFNTGFQNYFGDVADDWSVYTDVYASASPDVWANDGTDGNLPGFDSNLMGGVSAFEGSNWAAIGSEQSPSFSEGIESARTQMSAGLYSFSLAMLYDNANFLGYNDPGVLQVYSRSSTGIAHLGTLAANTGPKQWELRSLTFAVAQTDTMSFIISNENLAKTYIGLDDVRVNAVPEPGTLAVLGLGMLAARRRNRK